MAAPKLRFKEFKNDWVKTNLGEVVKFSNGKRVPLSESERQKRQGSYRYYGASGVIDYLDDYLFDGEYILIGEDGANIITRSSTLAFVVTGKFWVNNHAHIFQSKEGNNIFLAAYLESLNFEKFNSGTAQPKLNLENLKKVPVANPTKEEQTKIATFLSTVDEKISQLSQKLHLLSQYKQGMMKKLFSQQIRFKADDGSQFEEWVTKTIKELNLYISDGNYGELYPTSAQFVSHGVPFIRANNIKNLKVTNNDMRFIDENLHQILNSGHLKTNDIIVTTRGDIGMVALVDSSHEGSNINAQICLLRVVDQSQLSPQFLLYFLDSSFGQKQFKELQTGTALKQLPKKSLDKIITLVPSINEQTKIANFLSAIDQKIDVVSEQLKQAKLWKKGLLQQMFV